MTWKLQCLASISLAPLPNDVVELETNEKESYDRGALVARNRSQFPYIASRITFTERSEAEAYNISKKFAWRLRCDSYHLLWQQFLDLV
jgi:hypothetical protein